MTKALLFCSVFAGFIRHAQAAPVDPLQEARARYGVESASSYPQLLQAFRAANADFNAHKLEPLAMFGMSEIYQQASPDERLRLANDVWLQETGVPAELGAVLAIDSEIESGNYPDPALSKAIADKLWQDLAAAHPGPSQAGEFVRTAVKTLLLLLDDRGLDGFLTERKYVITLQVLDKWEDSSSVETFSALAARYKALSPTQAGARELAAFYELCKRRKAGGDTKIVSRASVIDLEKY